MIEKKALTKNPTELVETLANYQESDGKNILHMAAAYAAQNDDTRFFISLLSLNFPLYHEDSNHNFPAFLIVEVKNDSKFNNCYVSLLEAKFDLNRENSEDETFLTKVCKSSQVSENKMQGIIQKLPKITEQIAQEVDAKVSVTRAYRNKATKKALRLLKEYAATNFPIISVSNKAMVVYCCEKAAMGQSRGKIQQKRQILGRLA